MARRGWWGFLLVAIGSLALLLRLQLEVRGAGLDGIGSYDDGVHFAAAVLLVHGRVPYRDFLFLQPPGMLLAASPFALVANVVGDLPAFEAFRVAFELIGSLNAVLIAVLLRRFGWIAAVVGGTFYAVFIAAVNDERTALLEPAGTLGVLVALALLARATAARPRCFLAAGVALGVACDFKIWYVVAAAVVLGFASGGRLRVLVGLVAATAAVHVPFLILAPRAMVEQVVLAQLGRPRQSDASVPVRLAGLLGVSGVHAQPPVPGVPAGPTLAVLAMLTAAAAVVALLDRRARVLVALAAADLLVVLAAPSYYPHYDSLVAPLLALLAGVAVGWIARRLPRPAARAGLAVLMVSLIGALNVRHDLIQVDTRPPEAALRTAATRIPGCITADDPTVLAVMGALTPEVDRGCPLRPDVSGYSYGPDALTVDGDPLPRSRDLRYQHDLQHYLQSGSAFIVLRDDTGLSVATRAALDAGTVLFRDGRYVIRSTPTGSRGA